MTMSCRYRTLRGKKPTISHLLNGRQSKELRCNLKTKMKNPQQSKNIADAFWDVIHSNPPFLPNIKMSSILNVETDMQRKTRLGHTQLLQETLPNERKVCCPDSMNVNNLPSSVKDGKRGEGEHESLPASNNSQGFIFNAYQKENHELVKTDEEQKQPGSINIEVKLQIHFPQTILDSASCPIFDQFQFGKPERYARFPPPKSGEAKTDEIFSARDCVVPSDANHQKEQTGSIEKKETVTFGVCMSAFSTSKRKRNVRQYSDLKTLVKPKCGIFKVKKPSISYILNIKGDASTKHRAKLGCNLTTNMKQVDQDKKMADKMYSFMTIRPDINMYSNIEKGMLGDKRLSFKQVKQAIPLHKGNVASDDTKETNLQGEEEEERQQEALLKVLQHSKCFIFCSSKREELQLHKSENEVSGEILFVTEKDVPQQMQPIDSMQVEEPKKSHQTQNGTIYRANSKLPLLKSKESLRGQVLIDTMECGIPSNWSHIGELHNHGKEEKPEFNKNQQATAPESLDVSIHNPSDSKRQRRTFTCTPLKSKMNSKCVIMKARKTPISQIFNILGNGCLKNIPSRLLKSRISDFFIHINYSEVLEDLTVERKEGLAQELPATMLESLDLSTLALLTSKRKYLKCTGKRNKMSPKCITLKAKNAPISQTFNITKRGTSSHRRQFECNFKVMMEKCIPVADIILNAISSAIPISLDMNVNNRIKVETGEPQKMRFNHELQPEEQSPDGERAWCANSSDKRGSATLSMKKVKDHGGEALPWNTQHLSFNAHKMKEPHFVYSDLELKNSAREKIPESFTTTQELQQQALFTQHISHYISHSILNLRPFEKLRKRTKTKTELKGIRSTNILSSMPGKSINESSIDIAQSGILSEKSPGKELASFIRKREIKLQKDLPATALEYSSFPMPASSDFKGQRITAHIPKSRLGKAQIVLKTINITRSGVLSHGKQQDRMLENMAKEISLGMSDIFINTFLSSTPASPAIKRHHKVKTKKGRLRQKNNITRCWEQHEGKRLCTYSCKKWSTSKNTLESRGQNEKNTENNDILFKAGLPFLNRKGPRKDQNMLIAEQEVQRQTLVSENISESVCSPLVIPFQTEELQKNIPSQKNMLYRMSEKTSCPRAGKAMSDDLLINEREYSMTSDGSPIRKLDAQSAVSQQSKEEKEDIGAQKEIKYTVDQNSPLTKSENSVLGDPYDESSRRNVGGHIAKECENLKRDLLTRSMTSVLSESKRQKVAFKLPERKKFTGLISVDMKAKKPLCSEMLTATEHGTLDCRKEQECHLRSIVKDKQQHKSIANPFSSPTPFSTDNKIGTEMYSTLIAETDQQRVKLHNPTYFKLEKSPCYRETEKTNTTDTQSRSSYTIKMNVQENKKEVGVGTINLMFPKHQEKKIQRSKDEPGVLLTQASDSLPSLPLLKLDKEMQRISNTSEIAHTEPVGGDMKTVENKKQHIPQKEEMGRETTVAMRGLTHTTDISVTSKKLPPSDTLHRTELHVNIGSQGQRIHEGQEKPPGTVLRKVHICKSPTNLKLDNGTQVDVQELGMKRTTQFSQMVSTLSDAEKIEDTETIGGDIRKRKHLSQKENDREQHRTKVDKEITGFSPSQLQLPESSGAANIKYADSHEGTSSCTTIIKASEHMPYKGTRNRVKIEEGKGRILPQSITLRVVKSPLTHLLSRKTLSLNIKEQVKDVQKDKGKPEMVLRKTCASLPSPSHLKLKTRMNEKEVTLGTKQSCFPPLKIQNSSNSGKKPYTNSFAGFMLKKEDRLKIDVEDKMLPIYMDLKAKQLPLCTYSCKKWSTSKNPLESRWQNEKNIEDNDILFKAGLFRKGLRKDQNMLIAEQEVQRQTLVSENISESVCSPLVIPFQTEELQKNIPPQKDILQRMSEKISCPRAGKAMSDDLLINETKYSMTSDGSPIRKLGAQSAISLQSKKEKEDKGAKKKIKYTVDQNSPLSKSENSLLGDPYEKSSGRNVGGHIAKECEALKRDLLTRSMTSVLSESKRKNEVFKLPERKNLTSLISVDMKAKKPLCSEMLTANEHGNLDCRKEQECHLRSTIKGKQQHENIANPFSSPTPFSADNKTDIEMYCTLKAEKDQQRVKLHNPTYFKLEKSPCYRETRKANTTDTQSRSSYTIKMNVQENKKEVGVGTINLMFPKHQEKKIQGSKDEPGVLLTQASDSLPSLHLLKLDKEMQRISNASEVHTEPVGGDMKTVENKKQHIPQKEERGRETTVAMRGLTHTTDISVTSKKLPPSDTLHRTELHVNIGSQGQRIHEGQEKPPGTVLRKVHICKSPTNLKLDKGTQVDVQELGMKRTTLFSQMDSILSDAETIGGDVRKRKQHLSQKENDREQHRTKVDKEITGFSPSQLQLPESSGAGNIKYANSHEGTSSCTTIIKASEPYKDTRNRVKIEEGKGRILPQSITLRVERSPLTHLLSRKTLSSNIKEQVKDVQKDKGKPEMVLRKTCASLPSPSHLKWETGMNEKEITLRTTQSCLLPLKIQDSSISGKKAYTNSSEGYMLKGENRLKIDIEDKMLPIYMDLKAKKSPLSHTLNSKELQCKIKEQKRKVQEDNNKLVTKIKNICTSLLTVSDLKVGTTEGEGYLITITKEPVPQLQSTESSDAVDIAHAKSIDGELSNDVKEHMLQKEEKSREKNMDMKSIVEPNDMYLNINKSPILLIYNLSDLQRKTKEQEGKVQKVTCDPAGVMLTKTYTSSSSPLQLNMNIRIREKSMPTLTRSPVSPVNFQESSDSEKVIYVEPIIPDILIRPQEEKQPIPQNKEEVGVEMANPMFPIHQEKKMQESKDERKVKMQERKEYDKPKRIALQNEVDSGTCVRSLSISVMDLSQAGEMVESDTNLEKEKKICFSKFQKKSPNAGEIVKRNNSSTVKRGGQNFTNMVPEDFKPITEDHQQMQQLSNVKSEEHLYSEINKINLTPQAEERVVPGHDISRIIKEPDLLIIEQEEKAPKPILTPTGYPSMSGDPKENVETHMKHTPSMNISPPGVQEPQETQPIDTVESASPPGHRDQSEPIQDTTTQKVQQQKPFSETVPIPLQVESNEIQIVADSTSKESLLPLYDAIKNVFESQTTNVIQDKVQADKLEKVKARSPDDWKSSPFAEGPEVTSTTIHPKFQPKPILESKALEIKLNLIPKMEKQPFQKFDFYSKQTISKDNSQRFYPRRKKMSFLSLKGIDTIKLNLKQKYQKDSPQISCMKTLTVNVSGGSEEIITQLKSVSKLESGTSSVTSANKMPLFQILQNYSVEEKEKLLIHFSMKTLEIQMKAFPRIVRESYAMADTQNKRKPLSKCIHSSVKVPKQENTISLGFEEKSLHQIELDLQRKYLSFLLGLPIESMFPEPNILPKHIFKLNTAMCKKVDNSGESDCLSIHTDLLEQHTSFKEQSPHENSSLIRRFLEPTRVCASDPEQHGTAQDDTTVLSVLKPHVTPETNKHHVWFQETGLHASFDLKIQENAPNLVDCHSVQISQDFTDGQVDIKSSANLEKCSALEDHDSEESMFLEANPYLSQESENILFELQKGIPLENLYKMKQIKTDLNPLYSDNSGFHHIRGCRKSSSVVTLPSYESHNSRKYRSSSKVQSPDWLCHSSLNTEEVPFASSIELSEEKLSWSTKNRARYSLAPLTESNVKLHLAKSQDKPHRHPEGKKAKSDLFRNNIHGYCYPNYTQSKAKHTREKKACAYESVTADYFLSTYKPASKLQEDINLHYERKQNQPFFYACVPADALEIIPQTIRWTIPQKTLRKRNFRVPLVAKISSSFHMWSLSRKLGDHS